MLKRMTIINLTELNRNQSRTKHETNLIIFNTVFMESFFQVVQSFVSEDASIMLVAKDGKETDSKEYSTVWLSNFTLSTLSNIMSGADKTLCRNLIYLDFDHAFKPHNAKCYELCSNNHDKNS